MRAGSPTFGQWYGVELSAENKLQFLIPKGCAHGFSVLSPIAVFTYICGDYHSPEYERGVLYNDPTLNINWKLPANYILVSEKDKVHPLLAEAERFSIE